MMSRHQYEEVMRYIDEFYPKYSDPFDIKEKADEKRIELGEANKKKYFNKLFEGLKETLKGYCVRDYCDDDFPSLSFYILLHKDQDVLDDDRELLKSLGGVQFDLRVHISMISPYFCMFVQKTLYELDRDNETWFFSIYNGMDDEGVIWRVRDYLISLGLKEIKLDDSLVIVDDRETDCTELGKTTIYDCLFDNIGTESRIRGWREYKETPERAIVTEPDIDWDSLRYDPDKAEE